MTEFSTNVFPRCSSDLGKRGEGEKGEKSKDRRNAKTRRM
jgi:hypothetical protein